MLLYIRMLYTTSLCVCVFRLCETFAQSLLWFNLIQSSFFHFVSHSSRCFVLSSVAFPPPFYFNKISLTAFEIEVSLFVCFEAAIRLDMIEGTSGFIRLLICFERIHFRLLCTLPFIFIHIFFAFIENQY